jgi:hypothetical protein
MLTRNEAERLAAAIHCLRPEWPTSSLLTFLSKRKDRALLDITVQLAWVAQLPESKTPARVDEDGPWKSAVRGAEPINTTSLLQTINWESDCATCLKPRDHPWHGGLGTENDCDYLAPAEYHANRTQQEPA